jgi:hypothetical protein
LYEATEEQVNDALRAMLLADSYEVCCALLRGESVPVERLNAEWVKRYGKKK